MITRNWAKACHNLLRSFRVHCAVYAGFDLKRTLVLFLFLNPFNSIWFYPSCANMVFIHSIGSPHHTTRPHNSSISQYCRFHIVEWYYFFSIRIFSLGFFFQYMITVGGRLVWCGFRFKRPYLFSFEHK